MAVSGDTLCMLTHERLSRALRGAGEPALARRADKLEFDCLHHSSAEPMKKLVRVVRASMVTNKRLAAVHRDIMKGQYYNTDAEVRAARSKK